VYVRTNYPMTAFILDHSPGVVGEPWVLRGPGGNPAVQTKGAIRDCLKGVTSNTPTGLYRLALHPSVVLLWPQLLRPAGRSLTVMRPSGLPSVPGSGFPRPRCYRGMTVGERLPEGSPRIDNGVTHHFGKKLLVSTACHGVRSLPSGITNRTGAEVPSGASVLLLRGLPLHPRPESIRLATIGVKRFPLTYKGFSTNKTIHRDIHTCELTSNRHTHQLRLENYD
jgi:hypothetical protein